MPGVDEAPTIFEEIFWEIVEVLLQLVNGQSLALIGVFVALFALWAVHTLTLWLSGDPETAFHRATVLSEMAAYGYDTFAQVKNVGVEAMGKVIPVFNIAAKHVVEPAVWTALEVVSLVFMHKHYQGILPAKQVYEGFDCAIGSNTEIRDMTAQEAETQAYCGNAHAYAAHLGFVGTSGTGDAFVGNTSNLLLSTGAARRLQGMSAGQSLVGMLPIQPILDAILDIVGTVVEIGGTVADVTAHIVYTILTEVAVLIWNAAQVLIKAISGAVMQMVSSGMFKNFLKLGMDILILLLFKVFLPLMFAFIDLVMCMINFIMPATWGTQLQCSKSTQDSNPLLTLTTLAMNLANRGFAWQSSGRASRRTATWAPRSSRRSRASRSSPSRRRRSSTRCSTRRPAGATARRAAAAPRRRASTPAPSAARRPGRAARASTAR